MFSTIVILVLLIFIAFLIRKNCRNLDEINRLKWQLSINNSELEIKNRKILNLKEKVAFLKKKANPGGEIKILLSKEELEALLPPK